MNLYPEQLRRIAELCEGLNKIDGAAVDQSGSVTLGLPNGIPVVDEYGDVYAWLGDEIGGAWSAWFVKDNPYKGIRYDKNGIAN